ncbi:MAG: hypothetical protein LBL54_01780 [Clostridiales Family XIII bacterium]|nr:hypothetical protein [Clostridiales Family XIII bacterium]
MADGRERMMKSILRRHIVLTVAAILTLCLFAACSEDGITGTYKITKMSVGGVDFTAEQAEALIESSGGDYNISDAYLELKEDGTFELSFMGETYDGKYEVDGDSITFGQNSGTINGGTIVIEAGGYEVTFEKGSNVGKSSEKEATEETATEESATNEPADESTEAAVTPTETSEEEPASADASQSGDSGEEKWEITYSREEVIKNSSGDNDLYLLYEITNTGDTPLDLNDGLSGGDCDVYDKNGDIIAVGEYLSGWNKAVNPGEKGYIFSTGIRLNDYSGQEFTVDKRLNISQATKTPHPYPLEKIKITKGSYGGMTITGFFVNDTDETVGQYDGAVHYVIYGEDGLPVDIGGIGWLDRDVEAGKQIPFEISVSGWFSLFNQELDYDWAKDHTEIWANDSDI